MIYIYAYILLYYNLEEIARKYYLSQFDITFHTEKMSTLEHYNILIYMNLFVIYLYVIFIVKELLYYNYSHSYRNHNFGLAIIYIKYVMTMLINKNITLYEYEFSRYIMWIFGTPLKLKMFADINNLSLYDISIQYHVFSLLIHAAVFPYYGTPLYYGGLTISYLFMSLFLYKLLHQKYAILCNTYSFVWALFMLVNLIEELHLLDIHTIQILYLTIDIVSKFSLNLVIYDYNSFEINFKDNIDLQTFSFVSYILENIKKYEKENTSKTNKCSHFIHFIKQKFISIIPKNKDNLKKELLQKILPFNFDTEYIERISLNIDSESKQLKMICVLFTDIVNYTELAKRYNDKIIFELLNTIYNHFDKLIKKYAHLQKVETIGDAYMVVGDIYRNAPNHKTVIKEMIALSVDFLNDVPTIKTPDKIPLMLRIGISMGNVSIGILGNEIPRLCVVGNTVNVASRLQSTADANCIQISTHIHEQLGEIDLSEFAFHIEKNENVFLKNIGSVVTYSLCLQDTSSSSSSCPSSAEVSSNESDTYTASNFQFPPEYMQWRGIGKELEMRGGGNEIDSLLSVYYHTYKD